MTELLYLKNSYLKETGARIISVEKKGGIWLIILDRTIFYPQGGGQPSDTGFLSGKNGRAVVKHVRLDGQGCAIHESAVSGSLEAGEPVSVSICWEDRYRHMRIHSAGHIVHQAVLNLYPDMTPQAAEHGRHAFIEYTGTMPVDRRYAIELEANRLVDADLPLTTELVTLEELKKRSQYVPENLPHNKPLRILSIGDYPPVPDGGTQVKSTGEAGPIRITDIVNDTDAVRVQYEISDSVTPQEIPVPAKGTSYISAIDFISQLEEVCNQAADTVPDAGEKEFEFRNRLLGPKSEFTATTKKIRNLSPEDRTAAGIELNTCKQKIENHIQSIYRAASALSESLSGSFDPTVPGIRPVTGHLHIVTQAITEITEIFRRIGFIRVRHPELDWDWYTFESLNMPANHPARDEWETFFIESQKSKVKGQKSDGKFKTMVLTPHTSNGQVREMEKGKLPIRMINIAKCYRRQSDVSHAPMFHQFEGLYVDHGVSISHLKGVIEYFAKSFYGPDRQIRLRPFHFRFTEPSFEIDVTCGICLGKGCRLCKEGWLELGGSGMVHPAVLRNGGIDPDEYSGFAFGWGVERTYMMKSGTRLDDIRLLYSNDVRFLEQF